jgi:diguanylate cyclase (GGDEF)-like protein
MSPLPLSRASRFRRQLVQPIVGFGAALLCMIWYAVWHQVEVERAALARDVAQDTANLALVLEQNVARTASEIDNLLKVLRRSYERAEFKAEWASLVKEEFTINEQTVQIAVIDPKGMMITSTAMLYPTKPVDLSDREHFRVHLDTPYDRLFISKPVVGRASGRASVQFTRRFSAPDGGFGGVIVVSLDPTHLSRAYGGLKLGEGGGLAVIGRDDIIRAGTGIYAHALGLGFKEGRHNGMVEYLSDGTQLIQSEMEGQLRLVASRQVRGYDLGVIIASRDVRNDSTWLARQRKYVVGAAALSILVLLAVFGSLRSRRRHEAELIHLARHDTLTSLANRMQFGEAMENALAGLREGRRVALHLIDLDGFKLVNDTHGHGVGDKLLEAVAERLRTILRFRDLPARLGGDEFAVLQTGLEAEHEAAALAKRICSTLSEPYEIDGLRVVIGCSVGIALADKGSSSAPLMKMADTALYAVKVEGRGTFRFYDNAMNESVLARRSLEADLRLALDQSQLALHYQPIADAVTREVVGYEALLRWRHPTKGFIAPTEFIPIAEETGLIMPIGAWVLQAACIDMAKCPAPLKVAVNFSAIQFRGTDLVEAVKKALVTSGLEASRLEIEITESTLMQRDSGTVRQLHELNALGVKIVLDDFGTGYSSLSYLHTYPIHCIKIDRSFVSSLGEKKSAAPIVKAITALATTLGMRTVGEGVETREQLEALTELGCTEAQGYYFSPPRPAAEILPLSAAGKAEPALAA